MEEIKIPIEKINKHLSKQREVKILLYGILIGIISSFFGQLILAPLQVKTDKIGNLSKINIIYGPNVIGETTIESYFVIMLILFIAFFILIYKKIKDSLDIKESLEEIMIHSRDPEELAKEIKDELNKIIDYWYKDEELDVISKKEDNKFEVHVGDSSYSYIFFEINPQILRIEYDIDELVKRILEDLNKVRIKLKD